MPLFRELISACIGGDLGTHERRTCSEAWGRVCMTCGMVFRSRRRLFTHLQSRQSHRWREENGRGRLAAAMLKIACRDGHRDAAELLLDRDPHVPAGVLTQACADGHRDVVELLLDRGADLSETAVLSSGPAPSIPAGWVQDWNWKRRASYYRHDATGAVQWERPLGGKAMPLMTACHYGRLEVARLLLDRGATLKQPDDRRQTAPELYVVCRECPDADQPNLRQLFDGAHVPRSVAARAAARVAHRGTPQRSTKEKMAQLLLDHGANALPTRGRGCRRVCKISRELGHIREKTATRIQAQVRRWLALQHLYAPGGAGAEAARAHFNSLAQVEKVSRR